MEGQSELRFELRDQSNNLSLNSTNTHRALRVPRPNDGQDEAVLIGESAWQKERVWARSFVATTAVRFRWSMEVALRSVLYIAM